MIKYYNLDNKLFEMFLLTMDIFYGENPLETKIKDVPSFQSLTEEPIYLDLDMKDYGAEVYSLFKVIKFCVVINDKPGLMGVTSVDGDIVYITVKIPPEWNYRDISKRSFHVFTLFRHEVIHALDPKLRELTHESYPLESKPREENNWYIDHDVEIIPHSVSAADRIFCYCETLAEIKTQLEGTDLENPTERLLIEVKKRLVERGLSK